MADNANGKLTGLSALDMRAIEDAEGEWGRLWDERNRYVTLFEDGRFPVGLGGESEGSSVNLCFNYVLLMTAMLMRQDPVLEICARNPGDGEVDAFAEACTAWESYAYVKDQTTATNAVILFDALLRGIGWSKEHYDVESGMDAVDCVHPCDLFVDPVARYKLQQARYIVQRVLQPIEEARDFFGDDKLKANHSLAEEGGHARVDVKGDLEQMESRDLLLYYEIWRKTGNGRVVRYMLRREKKTLLERPWPYVLDGDDFPYTPLIFNTTYRGIKGFSEQKVVHGLVKEVAELFEWDRRHTRRTAARKVLVDGGPFKNKVSKLRNGRDMEVIALDVKNKRMEDVVKVLDMTGGADVNAQKGLYERAIQMHNMLLGQDEVIKGGANATRLTATEAEIRQDSSDLRGMEKRRRIDEFLHTQLRHRVQVARLLVDPRLVAAVAGQERGLAWEMYAGGAEDIVRELLIEVKAGSTSALWRQRRLQELQANFGVAQAVNSSRVQMGLSPAFDEVKIAMELFRAQGQRDPERWLVPEEPVAEAGPEEQMAALLGQGQQVSPGAQPMPQEQAMGGMAGGVEGGAQAAAAFG